MRKIVRIYRDHGEPCVRIEGAGHDSPEASHEAEDAASEAFGTRLYAKRYSADVWGTTWRLGRTPRPCPHCGRYWPAEAP